MLTCSTRGTKTDREGHSGPMRLTRWAEHRDRHSRTPQWHTRYEDEFAIKAKPRLTQQLRTWQSTLITATALHLPSPPGQPQGRMANGGPRPSQWWPSQATEPSAGVCDNLSGGAGYRSWVPLFLLFVYMYVIKHEWIQMCMQVILIFFILLSGTLICYSLSLSLSQYSKAKDQRQLHSSRLREKTMMPKSPLSVLR